MPALAIERMSVVLSASRPVRDAVSMGVPGFIIRASEIVPGSELDSFVRTDVIRWAIPLAPSGERACPLLPQALESRAIFVGTSPTADEDGLVSIVEELVGVFGMLATTLGPAGGLTAIVLRIPIDDLEVGAALVEAVHFRTKAGALANGVIPGEFGRGLAGGGTTHPEIEARRTSVADYIALRSLRPSDQKYMTRPEWLYEFNRYFARTAS